jgi:hypothetical protein
MSLRQALRTRQRRSPLPDGMSRPNSRITTGRRAGYRAHAGGRPARVATRGRHAGRHRRRCRKCARSGRGRLAALTIPVSSRASNGGGGTSASLLRTRSSRQPSPPGAGRRFRPCASLATGHASAETVGCTTNRVRQGLYREFAWRGKSPFGARSAPEQRRFEILDRRPREPRACHADDLRPVRVGGTDLSHRVGGSKHPRARPRHSTSGARVPGLDARDQSGGDGFGQCGPAH